MTRHLTYISSFLLLVLTGCITNDLPYPIVVPHITSVSAEGAESVDIDHDSQTVTLNMSEETDLRKVAVTAVALDKEEAVTSVPLVGVHDLTSPLVFNINMYRDYKWTLAAIRSVERHFTVAGQIGSSVIDPYNRRVIVKVAEGTDIGNLTVTSLKLGPAGLTTYSKDPAQLKDFTDVVSLEVTAFDVTEVWSIYVETTEVSVQITKVDPWTASAYVTSAGIAGKENGFRYRMVGYNAWTAVSQEDMIVDGGEFTAHIKGLMPQTAYEVVAYSGDETTAPMEFVTYPATPLPNGGFEYASKVRGADYYKFYDPYCGVEDGKYMFWGSGNGEGPDGVSGSAALGIVITYIDTEEKVEGRQSVRAQTSQMLGMLAAGNLFTGQFAGLVGTSGGKVNFGRPWATRPTALKLWCKYDTGKVDIVNGMPPGVNVSKDDYDMAEIKVAIGDWSYRIYGGTPESPVHINTTDASSFVDFNTDPSTIASGSLVLSDGRNAWNEYVIPLDYHTMDRMPTHIIISCAASRYGDYFTGCSRSKLWIDAMELIYE